MKVNKLNLTIVILLIICIYFRFHNLWYSNFQGDEVSAQNYLFDHQTFTQFLLSRTIGPGQFVITYLTNLFAINTNLPEFFIRLPFALANIAALILGCLVVKKYFGTKPAVLSTILIGLSGFFIAFARIAQYQSFVILFNLLALNFFLDFVHTKNSRKLIYAGIASGLSFLFHYDALSLIIPIVFFLLIKKDFKAIFFYVLPLGCVMSLFYGPFILSPTFKSTLKYLLLERVSAEATRLEQLTRLWQRLNLYHSKEFIVTTGFLSCAAVFSYVAKAFGESRANRLIRRITTWAETKENFVFLWLVVNFVVYGIIIANPLTHVYNILLPLFIFIGIEIGKYAFWVAFPSVAFLTVASLSFNYQAFIDTLPEYPWSDKTYIFGRMTTSIARGKEIKGTFGFPYARNLTHIRQEMLALKAEHNVSTFYSNEKDRILKYYLRGFKMTSENYAVFIYIPKPQSLIPSTLAPAGTTETTIIWKKTIR